MNTIRELNVIMKKVNASEQYPVTVNCERVDCNKCPINEYVNQRKIISCCDSVIQREDFAAFIHHKYEEIEKV